jgi:hypothetical protein
MHRASVKFHKEYLRQKEFEIQYIKAQDELCFKKPASNTKEAVSKAPSLRTK